MNIDERLEKLTERHEALTLSLELLSHEVRDLKTAVGDLKMTVGDLHSVTRQDAENIRALARIAEIHERRLTHIEGGE
jgi:prefoldin subunit 5